MPIPKHLEELNKKVEKVGNLIHTHETFKRNKGQPAAPWNHYRTITQADIDHIANLEAKAMKELEDEIFYLQTGCIIGETF